jgi:hypothetical protein
MATREARRHLYQALEAHKFDLEVPRRVTSGPDLEVLDRRIEAARLLLEWLSKALEPPPETPQQLKRRHHQEFKLVGIKLRGPHPIPCPRHRRRIKRANVEGTGLHVAGCTQQKGGHEGRPLAPPDDNAQPASTGERSGLTSTGNNLSRPKVSARLVADWWCRLAMRGKPSGGVNKTDPLG